MKSFRQGTIEGRPSPIISLALATSVGVAALNGCSANQSESTKAEKVTVANPIERDDIAVYFQSVRVNGQPTQAAMALADGYQNISYACVTMGTAEGLIAVPGTDDEINILDGTFNFNPTVSTCSDGSLDPTDKSVIKEEYLRAVATYFEPNNS